MASTTFVDYSASTPIMAAWLNDLNTIAYTALASGGVPPATAAQVLANIGADLKYINSGADGLGNSTLTLTTNTILTASSSGKQLNITGQAIITLPAPTIALHWLVVPNTYSLVQLATPSGTLLGGDMAIVTSPYTLNPNTTYLVHGLVSGSWSIIPLSGRIQVLNAVNANEAVALGQMLAPISVTASAAGNNTTVTVTASFTAPGPGVLVAQGIRNNGATAPTSTAATLYINGVQVASDSTQITTCHIGEVNTLGGGVSASYVAAASTSFSAYVMLTFIPTV